MKARLILIPLLLAACASASAQSQPQSTPAAPVATPAPAGPRPASSNKWRIKFDESAKSDGSIVFRVWPGEGAPRDVSVAVRDNQSENSIAHSTREAMRRVLGEAYHVEVDDGEDVLVKTRHGTARFGLQLLSNDAEDVDIKLHKE